MEAYSMDLRRRVMQAYDRGTALTAVATMFSLHRTTVYRWLKRRDRFGSIDPSNQHTGRKPKLSHRDHHRLAELVAQDPDVTLPTLKDRSGIDACLATLWRSLKRSGLTHKKRRSVPPSRTVTT